MINCSYKTRISSYFIAISALLVLTNNAKANEEFTFDTELTTAAVEEHKVEWHGYYEFEYWDAQDKNATFDAHKLVVWMGVKLHEKIFLSSEIEYEHFPRVGNNGKGGDGKIFVDSAYLRITPTKSTVISAGIFYLPFGIEWRSYPAHKNRLVTRPKVMKGGAVVPGTWSDVGIGVQQQFDHIGNVRLFYVNGDVKDGGVSRDTSSGGNNGKSIGAQISFDQTFAGVDLGASYVSGTWDEEDNFVSTRYGLHLLIDTPKISGVGFGPILIAEYVAGSDENDSAITGMDRDVSGFYVQLSSEVVKNFQVVARYGAYDNDNAIDNNGRDETSFGFVYAPFDHFQFKAEYQLNGEDGKSVDNDLSVMQLVAFW